MAQDLQIGRAGLASASGGDDLVLHLLSDDGWSQEGDKVTLRGIIRGRDYSTIADMKAARDQINGYGPENTDEPVIPVTSAQDSSRDGFYRVLRTNVDSEITGRPLTTGEVHSLSWPFSVELLRVPGWQAPLIEIVSVGDDRGGGSVASGQAWVGIPGSGDGYLANVVSVSSGQLSTTAAGTVRVLFGNTLYSGTVYYRVAAADYYKSSCNIEVTYDSGSTWRTLVGRQIPNDTDGWRLTNYRSRVTIVSGVLRVEFYDGTQWEATDFHVGSDPGGGFSAVTDWSAVSVTRNSPEAAGIKLTPTVATAALTDVYLGLRRGGQLIEGLLVGVTATLPGVFRTAAEGATSITGGIEATSANAAGNKFIILSPDALTKDVTGTCGVTRSGGATLAFGLSGSNSLVADVGGGGDTLTATESYFAANDIRQKVGVR